MPRGRRCRARRLARASAAVRAHLGDRLGGRRLGHRAVGGAGAAAARARRRSDRLLVRRRRAATRRFRSGPGYQVPFAERIRREAGVATGAVGLITDAGAGRRDHPRRAGRLRAAGPRAAARSVLAAARRRELGHVDAVAAAVPARRAARTPVALSNGSHEGTPEGGPRRSRRGRTIGRPDERRSCLVPFVEPAVAMIRPCAR